MTIRILDSDWTLSVASDSAMAPPVEALLPASIPATVPGDIASDLLNAGLIADPYYGRGELDCLWIGMVDWTLSTTFPLNSRELAESSLSATLSFGVVDTVAEYWLNGILIGSGQNMFRPSCWDVSSALRQGENRLEVRVRSPVAASEKLAADLAYPIPCSVQLPWQWKHRNLLRKVACHGGWDWGITLMSGGLYEAPMLTLGAAGRVISLSTQQVPCSQSSDWILNVSCEYRSNIEQEITLRYDFDRKSTQETFHALPGINQFDHRIDVRQPSLWWPAGEGEQALYPLVLSGREERVEKRIGFRSIEVIVADDEYGRGMRFRVNGRDIFAKGANWIPVDAFPARQTTEVYRRLLKDAVAANMNMIRLWGGGQYEKDVFYDTCDELGLLIWHDLMFSCSLYPATEDFLAEVDEEVRYQVKRLKDHPSIALWCGNNENLGALNWFPESRSNRDRYLVDYDRLNEGVIGRAVKELDSPCRWWPSSPSGGLGDYSDCWHDDTKGDMHYWSVWHENLPFESYYDVTPRFCSEFGFQSFPSMKTVAAYVPSEQWNVTSALMRHRQKNNDGNSIILSTMARYFRMPADFADFLWLSQVQQAYAIRCAVDYWRSQRPVAMGALFWQLNDNWPAVSWSSIEYDGSWKLLHYEARRFFAPLRLSLYRKDAMLYVYLINDLSQDARGSLLLRLLGFDGHELKRWDLGEFRCPSGSASEVFSLPLAELAKKGARFSYTEVNRHDAPDVVEEGFTDRFVVGEWHGAGLALGATPIQSSLFLTRPRDCELADARISVSAGSDSLSIYLDSDRPAFFVTPECDLPGRFGDAGFTLLPNEGREIRFLPRVQGRRAQHAKTLISSAELALKTQARHLRGTYQ